MTLYNYAVSGAVCSNKLTPRLLPAINAYYPSVVDYEIPAFIADKAAVHNGTDEAYFANGINPGNPVYTMWIGTNDVGVGAFQINSQTPGTVLTDYTHCVFSAFDSLYANSGPYFVLFSPCSTPNNAIIRKRLPRRGSTSSCLARQAQQPNCHCTADAGICNNAEQRIQVPVAI